jgi:hypothetical protein
MPRYARQKTMSECGPVAILNILKWAGWPVSYEKHISHIKRVSKYVYTEDFKGVKWYNIRKTINRIAAGRLKVRLYLVTDLDVLRQHVNANGAFIFKHAMTPDDDHYTAVVPGKNGKFAWINMGPKHTVVELSPEKFERRVLSTMGFKDQIPIALLISKL